jgi:hypothetical protein
MNITLTKTLGHDTGKRTGIDALNLTMTTAKQAKLAETIAADLTTMLTQAVNTLLKDPAKPGATLPMSVLSGYLEQLAQVTATLAEGHRFTVEGKPGADPRLVIAKK